MDVLMLKEEQLLSLGFKRSVAERLSGQEQAYVGELREIREERSER